MDEVFKDPIPVYSGMGFTKDQEKAIDKIESWYNSQDLVFTLSGAAGTGKTYLLDYLLKKVINKTVCVTAPTHKAVKVVENATNRKGRTLQSLHGLRPNTALENFDLDNIQFDPLGKEHIANYHLVIIDECSQINDALHELNLIKAKQYGTKILYVGDHRQLPPIKESNSRTFQINNFVVLNEVVRQKSLNPLLDLLEIAKRDVDKGSSELIKYLNSGIPQSKININSNNEGYIVLSNSEFQTLLIQTFKSEYFTKNVGFARYGAWTNSNILAWNLFIRQNLIEDISKIIHKDDLFTAYKTIVDEFGKVIISNSDDYFMESITERISDDGFKVFVVGLTSLTTGITTMTSVVDYKDPTFIRYKNKIYNLYYNARYSKPQDKSRNWRKYFAFKDSNLMSIDLELSSRAGKIVDIKKDIDYGYGLTIHKLQGSTFDNIFINLKDICFFKGNKSRPVRNYAGNTNAIDTRNKLAYTALSRASKKAIILW
jgi:hypothetical protein